MTLDKWIQWEVIYFTNWNFVPIHRALLPTQITWMVLIYERERCHIDELNASLHRYRVRYHDRTHHPTKIDLPRDAASCRNTVATVKCGKNLREDRPPPPGPIPLLLDKTRLEIRLLGRQSSVGQYLIFNSNKLLKLLSR